MAASFDKWDVELNYEPVRRQNPKYLSLSNKIVKMTTLMWILISITLILTGIVMFIATSTMSNLKNRERNSESATFGPTQVYTFGHTQVIPSGPTQVYTFGHTQVIPSGPTQVITSGPQDTDSSNAEIQNCGGIINVDKNTTNQIRFRHVFDNNEGISCTWIIKSDAEILNLQWSNTGELKFPQDELLIGELSLADEELYCRAIEPQGSHLTNFVTTPTILHVTSSFHFTPLNFEVKLIPVNRGGTHKSQPQTYYVNKKPAGSLGHPDVRSDSLLGMVAVFENNDDRQLNCSDNRLAPCCDSVEAYKVSSTYGRASCSKVPLSYLATQMHNCRTVVVLAPTHGNCQFNWKDL